MKYIQMCVYVYEYLPDVYISTMGLPGTHGGHYEGALSL